MADFAVISISSDEEGKPRLSKRSVPLDSGLPVKKRRSATADIIVLTDEEDSVETNNLNGAIINKDINGSNVNKSTCSTILNNSTNGEVSDLTDGISDDSVVSSHPTCSTLPSSLASNEIELCDELKEFLKLCEKSIENKQTKEALLSKLPYLKKEYNNSLNYVQSTIFVEDIKKKINQLQNDPRIAIQLFGSIVKDIKSNKVEYSSEKLRKLEKTLKKLKHKISKLSSAEVDWDEDEDSAFLKLDRYTRKAVEVHNKICKTTETDPYYGQPYFGRLDFGGSNYSQINNMINKKYQDRHKRPFPVFQQLDYFIRKCVTENKIDITPPKLDLEVKLCFEALGTLLQKRRRQDLASIHHSHLESGFEDPAKQDPVLRGKLDEHRKAHFQQLTEIEKKYVALQHVDSNPPVSGDSDDSSQMDDRDSCSD